MINSKRLTAWYNFQAPAYHLWRDDYDGPLVEQASRLLGATGTGEACRMLDTGCGSGLLTIGLAKRRPTWSIEGVDASSGLLRIARKQAAKHGVTNAAFVEGDVTALPHRDGSFEIVTAAGLFPNLNDHKAALDEIYRVLRPEGHLLIIEFDRASMTRSARLFFRGMIAAYSAVSFLFRRFRFAERWSVETSTIDPSQFEHTLRQASLTPVEVVRHHNHIFFHSIKRAT